MNDFYWPLLVMPISGVIILAWGWTYLIITRRKRAAAERRRHPQPGE
jgi:hypothetical protein